MIKGKKIGAQGAAILSGLLMKNTSITNLVLTGTVIKRFVES